MMAMRDEEKKLNGLPLPRVPGVNVPLRTTRVARAAGDDLAMAPNMLRGAGTALRGGLATAVAAGADAVQAADQVLGFPARAAGAGLLEFGRGLVGAQDAQPVAPPGVTPAPVVAQQTVNNASAKTGMAPQVETPVASPARTYSQPASLPSPNAPTPAPLDLSSRVSQGVDFGMNRPGMRAMVAPADAPPLPGYLNRLASQSSNFLRQQQGLVDQAVNLAGSGRISDMLQAKYLLAASGAGRRSFDSATGAVTPFAQSLVTAGTQRRGQDIGAETDIYRTDVGADTQRRGQDIQARGQDMTDDRMRSQQELTRYGYDTQAATNRYSTDAAMARYAPSMQREQFINELTQQAMQGGPAGQAAMDRLAELNSATSPQSANSEVISDNMGNPLQMRVTDRRGNMHFYPWDPVKGRFAIPEKPAPAAGAVAPKKETRF